MSRRKKLAEMSPVELEKVSAEFEREGVAETFGPPDRQPAARWQRAKRKRGRPTRGEGAERISVTVEKSVLRRIDAVTKKTGQTRAQLIERGLLHILAES